MQFEPLRIYHEHQSSQLCARHCLNNLLQGPYFTEFDLSQIALALDKEEQALLCQDGDANGGLIEWLKHNPQSQNVSDDGNFSIQVLRRALSNLNLTIYHFGHEYVQQAQKQPEKEQGFICNLQAHWFSIRRIGGVWYNLNSLSGLPETKAVATIISNFYLSAFLSTLQNDGYSIFVVRSDNWPHLHSYDAYQLLPQYASWTLQTKIKCRSDSYPKHLLEQVGKSRNGQHVTGLGWGNHNNNSDFEHALALSMQGNDNNNHNNNVGYNNDPELAHALALSMQGNKNKNKNNNINKNEDEDEDMMLQQALAMSMEDEDKKIEIDVVEIEVVDEPDESEVECCSIMLRFGGNKRIERRFKKQHKLGDVADFVRSLDESYAKFNGFVFVCPPMNSYNDMEMFLEDICKELNSTKLSFIVKENANKE